MSWPLAQNSFNLVPKQWDYKHAYKTSEPTKINESNEAKKRWCLVRRVAGRAVEGLWNPSCLSVEDTKRRKNRKKTNEEMITSSYNVFMGMTLGGLKIGHLCGTLKSSLSLKCNLMFYGGTRIAESSTNTSKIQEFHACPARDFISAAMTRAKAFNRHCTSKFFGHESLWMIPA